MDRLRRLIALPAALVTAFVIAAPAGAHVASGAAARAPSAVPAPLTPSSTTKVIDGSDTTTPASGPCTAPAEQSVPDGGEHEHLDVAQHRFACGLRQVALLSLQKELARGPTSSSARWTSRRGSPRSR